LSLNNGQLVFDISLHHKANSAEKLDNCKILVTAAETWDVEDEGAASIVPFGSEIDMITKFLYGFNLMVP
jgi:hypothetical protein